MYLDVKNRNHLINVFEIPFAFFKNMFNSENKQWELLKLYITDNGVKTLVSVTFAYKTNSTYCPLIIGMDYNYLIQYKIYKQSLFQMMLRAKQVGCTHMHLGFGASLEKRKLGAKEEEVFMFIQLKDNFNYAILSEIEEKVIKENHIKLVK